MRSIVGLVPPGLGGGGHGDQGPGQTRLGFRLFRPGLGGGEGEGVGSRGPWAPWPRVIYIQYMKPARGPQTMFFGNDCCGIIVLQIQMGAGRGS